MGWPLSPFIGPLEPTVIPVPVGATHMSLAGIGATALVRDIARQKPLFLSADSQNVYYRWTQESTGATGSSSATSGSGPTAQVAILHSGQRPNMPEAAPQGTTGIVVFAPGGATFLRIYPSD